MTRVPKYIWCDEFETRGGFSFVSGVNCPRVDSDISVRYTYNTPEFESNLQKTIEFLLEQAPMTKGYALGLRLKSEQNKKDIFNYVEIKDDNET
jgi:hypothetical protein